MIIGLQRSQKIETQTPGQAKMLVRNEHHERTDTLDKHVQNILEEEEKEGEDIGVRCHRDDFKAIASRET